MTIKKQKGFTLIELLVVIAIIGILAGILVVAINPKAQTDKAEDAKIKAALNGVRTQAALFFSDNNNTFTGFTGGNVYTSLSGTKDLNISADGTAWAAYGTLSDGGAYCVDSAGNVGDTALGADAIVCS